jgi:hypothetical protein
MASKKIQSGDYKMETLFNEDSEDHQFLDLILVAQMVVKGLISRNCLDK